VYPFPPHCPYFATTAPVVVATGELVAVAALLVVAVIAVCVVGEPDVVGTEPPVPD
jgi:hypothetical protein